MLKRKLGLIMCSVLLMSSIFAGCGQEEPTSNEGATDSTVVEEQEQTDEAKKEEDTTEVKEPVTIKFYTWKADREDALIDLIDKFESNNPDIKVEYELIVENDSNEYAQKVDLMLTAGDTVDVIMHPNPTMHITRADKGLFYPLDDLADKMGDDLDEIFKTTVKINDVVYGMPFAPSTNYVLLNKDHLDEAGLEVPPLDWTWDDYRNYALKLSQGEGSERRYGSYMHSWGYYHYIGSFSVFDDNPFYKSDGSSNFDHPVFKEFLEMKYAMENEDKSQIPFSDVISGGFKATSAFFEGKVSMQPVGTWTLGRLNSESTPHDFKIAIAAHPRMTEDDPIAETGAAMTFISINKNAEHPEEAYRFIKYFTSSEGQIIMRELSAARNADQDAELRAVLGEDPEKNVDMDSLVNFMSNRTDAIHETQPSYNAEVEAKFVEEAEKYLVGGQDIDVTMENIIRKSQEVIENNQ